MFTDRVLTITEVATFLKIPKSSVYKLIHEGGLPAHKVGKHFRLMQAEVNEWLQQGGIAESSESYNHDTVQV